MEVFDDTNLVTAIMKSSKPFITALGHEEDKPLLARMSDRNIPTPTAFGSFLQSISETYSDRQEGIKTLRQEITQWRTHVQEITSRHEKEIAQLQEPRNIESDLFRKRLSSMRKAIIIVILVFALIIGLVL